MRAMYLNHSVICIIALGGIGLAGAAEAQFAGNAPITVATNQSVAGAAVGNGVTQGKPVAVVTSNGRPAVGVGALSAQSDHYGSAASVSVANNERLVGVDGPGGYRAPINVSVDNPRKAPVLSGPHR